MRRLLALVLLVPLVAGCSWASLLFGDHLSTGPVHVHALEPMNPVPRWVRVERLPQKAIPGAALFYSSGCVTCHTYAGSGSRNLGAPDLTAIGRHQLGIPLQIKHLRNPPSVTPGSPMPAFASLGPKRLRELAIFLEASKGQR
jgi:mono/diheme cytochrome c family protein